MRHFNVWVMAAALFCGTSIFTSCTDNDEPTPAEKSLKEELRAQYGENKKITDGNYDPSLAVKCINGTFVGRKTGKYADFLLVTKDVLTCPVTEIHEAKPAATYFEGRKVYSM